MQTLQYFANLRPGKQVLWCYLIWYLVTVVALFDPSPRIWINSLGISLIIGFALLLSVSGPGGKQGSRDAWQLFRLFMMPFGVSSFSSLIKGKEYIFVFPPDSKLLLLSAGSCAVFVAFVLVLKLVFPAKSKMAHSRSDA